MSKPINCPACGVKMDIGSAGDEPWVIVWIQCPKCGLRSDHYGAVTHRGAAIKAGRAMRRIVEMVWTRIAKARIDATINGKRAGEISMARTCYWMLLNSRMTRRQITERMRQEAADALR